MVVKAEMSSKAKATTAKKAVSPKRKPAKKAVKKKSVATKVSTTNKTAIIPIVDESGLDAPSLKNLNSSDSPMHPERVWPD